MSFDVEGVGMGWDGGEKRRRRGRVVAREPAVMERPISTAVQIAIFSDVSC